MMKTLKLIRIASDNDGTYGVLVDGLTPFAVTLERQWLDNAPNISCIPNGTYTCKRVNSPRFGETFEVMDVPNRSHILFHKGNTENATQGCILVGEQFESLHDKTAVLQSQHGYAEFMNRLSGSFIFILEIRTA
ncbi:MAG: DUF5675 family protein [Deltaproteobacteria bacterium]|nr:DUF5675 family protein [Deltaproteobacteria bacterium]